MIDKKVVAKDQWAEKYLRESVWMPFGSLCNLYGQVNQGQAMSKESLKEVAEIIFGCVMDFTEKAFNRTERQTASEKAPELQIKNDN